MTCRLMKMEHLDSVLDFDTEFHALTAAVLPFFGGSLTLMDLQQEFQSAGEEGGRGGGRGDRGGGG